MWQLEHMSNFHRIKYFWIMNNPKNIVEKDNYPFWVIHPIRRDDGSKGIGIHPSQWFMMMTFTSKQFVPDTYYPLIQKYVPAFADPLSIMYLEHLRQRGLCQSSSHRVSVSGRMLLTRGLKVLIDTDLG